jgi:hypothetical protein
MNAEDKQRLQSLIDGFMKDLNFASQVMDHEDLGELEELERHSDTVYSVGTDSGTLWITFSADKPSEE